MSNFSEILKKSSTYFPNKIALKDEDRCVTYRELDHRVTKLASALIDLGLQKGTKIAEIHYNSVESIECIFAISRAGFIRVPLNARLSLPEQLMIIDDCEAEVLIIGPEFLVHLEKYQALHKLKYIIAHHAEAGEGYIRYETFVEQGRLNGKLPNDLRWEDVCDIRYTSGSTGKPKGVVLSNKSEILMAYNILTDLVNIQEHDVILHTQPFSHGGGAFIPPAFMRGATNIIAGKFDVKNMIRMIEEEQVSIIKLVPTMLVKLLEEERLLKSTNLSSIKKIIYGASPMPHETLQAALEIFGPIFSQTYGQTEVPSTITFLPSADHDLNKNPHSVTRMKSVGKPYSMVEMKVVNSKGEEVPAGEVGEIIVRSPHRMDGYYNNDAKTKETIKDEWVYTGDLGMMDEDGYYYLTDRKNDLIISGGFNVYPSEVEDALHGHKKIKEAAVFGVPDPAWVEKVVAVVSAKNNLLLEKDEINEFLKDKLANYKRPKEIYIIEELPKSSAEKIDKKLIKAWYLENKLMTIKGGQ